MAETQTIIPDIDFIKSLQKSSNASLKECMQCGTCSVVCKLSPKENPFPRKEMIWASWGLKDKLIGNPDVWLCHQCGDCSTECPRGVKPADVLATIRQQSYLHYSRPKFLAKWMSSPAYLPLVLGIPMLIIHSILIIAGTLHTPEGPVDYSKIFPHGLLNSSFSIITLLAYSGSIFGLQTFWKDMKKILPGKRKTSLMKSFSEVIKDILIHKNFNTCETNKFRSVAHFMVFWGFLLLLGVTLVAIVNVVFFEYPMKFLHPAKIAGNFASLLLFFGIGVMIFKRLFNKKAVGNSNYSDWFFLITLFLLTLSGTLTELARFGNWEQAYYIYLTHLILVWVVFINLPFSKFGHLMYRTLALAYAKSRGREL
ncbi:quinone-interacting membrane-bound oxidoreductase complex subunit QmoC [Bacteroidota bacterium]